MLLDFIILIVGAAMVLLGADALTGGASDLARRWGISELIIGLTVVALGTSMPEFVVSVISSFENKPDLAIGNVIGSNLFNTLVILGITALICPVSVSKQVVGKDIPWSILSSVLLLIMASGTILDGEANNELTRSDGLVLLLIFITFIYYTILVARKDEASAGPQIKAEPAGDANINEAGNEAQTTENQYNPLWKSILFILLGLVGLIWGGDLFVDSASDIAFSLGMSEGLIGLTIVAIGTSLPELATSVVAACKNKAGMAIGNAIGSNIFNVLLILGASATVTPLHLGNITVVDLLMLVGVSFLVWLFARTSYTLSRWEGGTMIGIYICYMIYLILIQ